MSARAGRLVDAANLHTMQVIHWRTGWPRLLAWVGTMVFFMAITVASMAENYGTPEKQATYGQSLASGPAMLMLNGRIAGIDTLGGIVANEFGFLASFALPVMGIGLVNSFTRREEEVGRLELLLASAIGRHAPLVSALLTTAIAAVVLGLGSWTASFAADLDHGGAAWYSAGLAGVVLFFAGVGAVAAQVFENGRGVWMAGLATAVLAMLVRGIGAVRDAWYGMLSPLGLLDGIRSFGGAPRAWPLLVLFGLALVLMGIALVLAVRRDLGGALVRAGAGPAHAGGLLRTGLGLALQEHRGGLVGWAIGAAVMMGIYGSLTQDVVDAIKANPSLEVYVQAGLDQVMGMFVLMAGMIAAACAIALHGAEAGDEHHGRLEVLLAGPRSRLGWLGRHLLAVALGSLLVLMIGAAVLAGSASMSLGNDDVVEGVVRAALGQTPVVLAFSGLAVLMWAWRPRLRGIAWGVFGIGFFLGFMGQALDLPDWLVENSPFLLAGRLPAEEVDWIGVGVLCGFAVVSHLLALVALRRRDVPR